MCTLLSIKLSLVDVPILIPLLSLAPSQAPTPGLTNPRLGSPDSACVPTVCSTRASVVTREGSGESWVGSSMKSQNIKQSHYWRAAGSSPVTTEWGMAKRYMVTAPEGYCNSPEVQVEEDLSMTTIMASFRTGPQNSINDAFMGVSEFKKDG